MNNNIRFFATTPKGLELLLVDELKSLGATVAKEKLAGVEFYGSLEVAYKACLWSRLANRILLHLAECRAETPEELYQGVKRINWSEHIPVDGTLAVQCVSVNSKVSHTMFAAQKIKDAIVDQLRQKFDRRPNVKKEQPDVQINVHIKRDVATVYLDLSGESLHKRGYRLDTGEAPLKENLAAALLIRAKWPEISKRGGALFDPMCGSGTLVIEGALMAYDIAPGLHRKYFGFLGWKKHQAQTWEKLVEEAMERQALSAKQTLTIVGYDQNPEAIKIAFANIERAKLRGLVHVEKRELNSFMPRVGVQPGLVMTNPPYGERLGEVENLAGLYFDLGTQLKTHFVNWQAGVFTGNPDLAKKICVHSIKQYALFNGTIACKLFLFDLKSEFFINRKT